MSGALWAAVAGIGFGLFQSLNARAVRGHGSVYGSTFVQMLAAAGVLLVAALATADVRAVADESIATLALFAAAGVVHFLGGWTLLSLSHARIGAARTSPLLATTPAWGLLLAMAVPGQLPGVAALGGIGLTIAGACMVGARGGIRGLRLGDVRYGLGTAAAWALGAVLIGEALQRSDASPLVGVTLGVLAAAAAYGVLVVVTGTSLTRDAELRAVLGIKSFAGVIVGLATWARWLALDDADVGVVLALNLLSVPVVLVVAPRISGRAAEVVTPRVVLGATLVCAGALVLILAA